MPGLYSFTVVDEGKAHLTPEVLDADVRVEAPGVVQKALGTPSWFVNRRPLKIPVT